MDSSNFWKLDKIDKIGISLIFIIFAIYSTFSCFATETESVSYDGVINNAIIYEQTITANSNYSLYYIEIEPGYRYTCTANQSVGIAFGNGLEYGDETTPFTSLSKNDSFSFTYSDMKYVYFFSNADNASMTFRLSVTREPLEGMQGSVDLLSGNVGFNLWESFTNTIVYALPITITCFGIYIICGFIKKFSKGA